MAMRVTSRDVDKLDPLPDDKIKQADRAYLEKHQIDGWFCGLLMEILQTQPPDVIQFIVDCQEFGLEEAQQDPATGLSQYRRRLLLNLFQHIDKAGQGEITYKALQLYCNNYGGSLSDRNIGDIFRDFKTYDGNISLQAFYGFFSNISKQQTNEDFQKMLKELLS